MGRDLHQPHIQRGLISKIYKELKNWDINKQNNLKWGYRSKQRILDRGIPNVWEALKEMSNILSCQGNANPMAMRFLPFFIPIKMAKIKKKKKLKDQHMLERLWSKGNTFPLLVGIQTLQALCKSIWQFLRKLRVVLSQDPSTQDSWVT